MYGLFFFLCFLYYLIPDRVKKKKNLLLTKVLHHSLACPKPENRTRRGEFPLLPLELQYCTTTSYYSFCRAVIDRQSIVGLTQKDRQSFALTLTLELAVDPNPYTHSLKATTENPERSRAANEKVGGSIPGCSNVHAKVSLGIALKALFKGLLKQSKESI